MLLYLYFKMVSFRNSAQGPYCIMLMNEYWDAAILNSR